MFDVVEANHVSGSRTNVCKISTQADRLPQFYNQENFIYWMGKVRHGNTVLTAVALVGDKQELV